MLLILFLIFQLHDPFLYGMTIASFCLIALLFIANIFVDKRALYARLLSRDLLPVVPTTTSENPDERTPLLGSDKGVDDSCTDKNPTVVRANTNAGEINPKMTSSFLAEIFFVWFTP